MINSTFMPRAVKYIATINEKRNEPVIKELERAYQIRYYSAEELKEIAVPTPSPVVEKHMGTPSVSEAAAFLSANGGKLLLDKQKGGNYTMPAKLTTLYAVWGYDTDEDGTADVKEDPTR